MNDPNRCDHPGCDLLKSHIFHGPCNPGKPNQCTFPHGGIPCHVFIPQKLKETP